MDSRIGGGNSSHRMQYSYLPETVLKLVPQLNFPRDNNTTAYTFICDHHAPDNDFRFIIDVYVVCVICLFGFVGNALTIVVLRHDKDRLNSTNWLLQTLALVDMAYLIACLVIQPVKAIHDSGKFESHLYPYIEMYFWTIAGVAQTITVWTVVLVTIDRYIAVCKPFKAELRSLTRTKCSMFGVVLAAIIYNSPLIFEREIKMKQKDCSTDFVPFVQTTEIVSNKVYSILYKTVCYLVFRTIGPLVMLTILNIRLVQSLRMVHQKQKRNSSRTASARSNRQRENLTLMLVVVITVFIVCELPDTGLRLAVIVNTDILPMMTPANSTYFKSSDVVTVSDASKLTFSGVNTIANMLLALNSAVNFIIYCLVGKKFRRILCVHLCRVTNLAGDSSTTLGGGGAAQMKTLAVAVDDDKINAAAVAAPPASVVDEQIKCETGT